MKGPEGPSNKRLEAPQTSCLADTVENDDDCAFYDYDCVKVVTI